MKRHQTRIAWCSLFLFTSFLLAISHYFFQTFLYMKPCEQCVYIRFAMFCIAFGSLAATFCPHSNAMIFFAYLLGFYGIFYGTQAALTLQHIHEMVLADNPFIAMSGCKKIPIYPFNLPLHIWFPSWFLPTGECGLDAPMISQEAIENLNVIQKFFIEQYANGWYLIPQLKWINMATFCLIYFIVCGFFLLYLLVALLRQYLFPHQKRY